MKKLLLTLIAMLFVCGSIFAYNDEEEHPETAYPGFNDGPYEMQGALYASFSINGVPVDMETADWEVMEIAAFITLSGEEVQRSYGMFLTERYVVEYGELFPTTDLESIYYTTPNDVVYFKMHNHATNMDYTFDRAYLYDDGTEVEILTGYDYWGGLDDPDHPLMLNFVGEEPVTYTYTKSILGYNGIDGNGRYYLIATPFAEVSPEAAGMFTYAYDFYYFNQTNVGEEWINQKSNTADEDFLSMPLGKGYLYASEEDVDLVFTGYRNEEETYTINLLYAEDADLKGYNLVGNPYGMPATVDRDFLRMNEDGTNFMPGTSGEVVETAEGIFVQATSPDDNMVTFVPDMGMKDNGAKLSINLNSGRSLIDRAVVRFGESRELNKLQLTDNSTSLYFSKNDEEFAVVNCNGYGEMPLNFKAETTGTYTFSFNADNVNFSYLHLIDLLTGEDVDLLTNNSYEFVGSPRDNENRFVLSFSQNDGSDIFAYQNDNDIIVNGEGTLQVFDVMGRFVGNYELNGIKHISASEFSTGVYIFRLIGSDTKTQKIVVR